MKKLPYFFIVYICVFSVLFTHTFPVYAGIVGTNQLLDEFYAEQNRENLLNIVARKDARILLEQNGVSTEQAIERINAMTDAEVQMLAQDFENLPAAGSIGTAAALLILILLILVLALK